MKEPRKVTVKSAWDVGKMHTVAMHQRTKLIWKEFKDATKRKLALLPGLYASMIVDIS
jgi:hypothetical protein